MVTIFNSVRGIKNQIMPKSEAPFSGDGRKRGKPDEI
ncbi:hypothetical protein CLOLEP_01515 [[Clostridium] leptum DSM 753]|jgi:hypothetical protein|uniref:Uncharacterized protein n=1 Tax=[Clostridium] leptum DSM 753 TaxID=428125 RepID=A7VSH4_9FIRM|nr:hypothetical protein CLOLEP_01515 [[Clostridium] leptum DSM 753]